MAGSFRKKTYGLEYRSPSSVWLASKERCEMVFNIVNDVLRKVEETGDADRMDKVVQRGNTLESYATMLQDNKLDEEDIRLSINQSSPIQPPLLNYFLG
jgi:hypothetical protein